MTLDKKELKAIKHYLEVILNVDSYIHSIDGEKYVKVKDLQDDLQYIRNIIRKG